MEIVGNVGKTNNFHDCLTENVGKTNNSNNFHEFRETSGARVLVWKIMEIVGKTNIFHDLSLGNHWKILVKPTISIDPPPSDTHVLVFMLLRDKSRRRYRGGGGGTKDLYKSFHAPKP